MLKWQVVKESRSSGKVGGAFHPKVREDIRVAERAEAKRQRSHPQGSALLSVNLGWPSGLIILQLGFEGGESPGSPVAWLLRPETQLPLTHRIRLKCLGGALEAEF